MRKIENTGISKPPHPFAPLKKIDGWVRHKVATMSGKAAIAVGIVLVFALGIADYHVGYEISFSVFYLLPVSLVAWSAGRWPAIFMGVFSAVMWLAADLAAGISYTNPAIAFWNTMVRFWFFIMTAYFIVELRNRLKLEERLSREDSLTEVANARSFYQYVSQEVERTKRHGRPFTLAYIDVDNFKGINDGHGHAVGDDVLRRMAQTIRSNIRSIDVVARLGGDEFALLLPETGTEEARTAIERLRERLRDGVGENGMRVTSSFGVVTVAGAPPPVRKIVRKADDLMYSAKQSGKDRASYEVWDKESQIEDLRS
jgi:diguanylate cyclase (GGDEF)-like protein